MFFFETSAVEPLFWKNIFLEIFKSFLCYQSEHLFKAVSEICEVSLLTRIYGTKYSRMDQVKFLEDSL